MGETQGCEIMESIEAYVKEKKIDPRYSELQFFVVELRSR